ncbi:MAG: TIR domain-containing protein [Alphaproteobacteria bacterium]|nr:TIR domain-containing protein [Alphaproteobacteria bacterium]
MVKSKNNTVFLSYARENVKAVQRIDRELRKYGFETWFDGTSIIGGTAFAEEINDGIDKCALLLFMQSPEAIASVWTAKECDRAANADKPIVPVLISTIDLKNNRFPDLHWIDFVNREDGDRFDQSMFELIKAIDTHTSHPACPAALETLSKRLGPARIEEHVEEIRRNTVSAHKWLDEINAGQVSENPKWAETDRKERAGKLVTLATGEDVRDPQIIAYAAQTIARTGDLTALRELGSGLTEERSRGAVLESFRTIWETRPDGLPSGKLSGAISTARRAIALHQFSKPPQWATLGAIAVGCCFAIMFTIYMNFGDGAVGVQILGRWSDTLSSGISYGLPIGVGIALTLVYLPRLKILRNWQYVLGPLVGWTIVFLAFWGMNVLFNTRISHTWDNFTNIAGLSFMLICGFAAASFIPPNSVLAALLRTSIAFAGVFLAIRLPCDWSLLHARLLTLHPDQCVQQAWVIAAAMTVPAFLPEIWRNATQREGQIPRLIMRIGRAIGR